MKPRFDVISIYTDSKCNMSPRCTFCYMANKPIKGRKPNKWWLQLPKYLKGITEQIAFANLEPLLFPGFVRDFAKECRKYKIIPNITTNGILIPSMSQEDIKRYLGNLGMIAISMDWEKIKHTEDITRLYSAILKLKIAKIKVGITLLIRANTNLSTILDILFNIQKVDYVYLLHKKPFSSDEKIDLLLPQLRRLQKKYPNLYFDDFILQVEKYGYKNWKGSCHYGKNSFSIMPDGAVSGCSFAPAEFYLNDPKDILKLKTYKFKERFKCVYGE